MKIKKCSSILLTIIISTSDAFSIRSYNHAPIRQAHRPLQNSINSISDISLQSNFTLEFASSNSWNSRILKWKRVLLKHSCWIPRFGHCGTKRLLRNASNNLAVTASEGKGVLYVAEWTAWAYSLDKDICNLFLDGKEWQTHVPREDGMQSNNRTNR